MATGATATHALPYPLSSDPVRVAGDIEQLAEKIDVILTETIEDTAAAMFTGATVSNGFVLPTYNDTTAKMTLTLAQDIQTTASPTFAGATIDSVKIGVTAANEIDTSSGNLILDSATGTTQIDDNLTVSGDITVSGGDITAGNVASTVMNGNTTTNVTIAGALTSGTLTIGGTASTGTITIGRSTGAQTINISSGATTSGTTNTINLGGSGVSGSITNVNIGSSVAGATGKITLNQPITTPSQFTSTVANGTAPFVITSTTLVSNLNADLLDGQQGSYYNTAGNLTGTIPSAVLGNSTVYVGTTAIALNRASASQSLTGITSIDGSAATLTTGRTIGMTGDVSWTSGSFNGSANVTGTSTIANSAVTYAKIQNVSAQYRVLGRITTGAGIVEELTPDNIVSLINQASTAIAATEGGTGQTGYTIGDLLYASSTTALSKLAGVATGNVLISGGVGAAPSWNKVGLTTHISGTLAIGNGGTGLTGTPTNGQLLIGNGTGYSLATLTAGDNVTITNTAGGITISSTGGGGSTAAVGFEATMFLGGI